MENVESMISVSNKHLIDNRPYQALLFFEELLPEYGETLPGIRHNIGLCYELVGRFDEAIHEYKKNVDIHPKYIRSYIGVANCMRHRKQNKDALEWLLQALEVDEVYPQTYFLLGVQYNLLNDIESACHYTIMGYIKAAQVDARDSMHYTQAYMDHFTGSVFTCRKGSPGILSFLYCENIPEDDIFLLHKFFDQSEPLEPIQLKGKRGLATKMRIGYISENIKNSSQMSCLLPLLEHHDPDNFDIYVYNLGDKEDVYTEKVKQVGIRYSWFKESYDIDSIRKAIGKDDLDILVSLDGHTCLALALKVMHERIAKVQMDFLGYPFSTMKESIDYKIVDDFTDPDGSEKMYSEILLKPNKCFLLWKPLCDVVFSHQYIPNTPRKILSPNNFMKLSRTTIDLYKAILGRTDAHLYLKSSNHESGTYIQEFFDTNFKGYEERIHFIEFIQDMEEHFNNTSLFDIVLDTTPYNGTITTLESLYASTPVVTLCGNTHRSRVSADILDTINHQELIARSNNEYVDVAVRLLNDPARLVDLHANLRGALEKSSIMQYEKYVRNLENSYTRLLK